MIVLRHVLILMHRLILLEKASSEIIMKEFTVI